MRKETFHQYQVGDRLQDRQGRKGEVRTVGPVDYLTVLFDGARFPERITAGWTKPLNEFDQPVDEGITPYQERGRVQEQKFVEQTSSLKLLTSLRFRDFFKRLR